MQDPEEAVAFMQRFSFAVFTSVLNNEPVATHLPVVTEVRNGKVVLIAHLAKANVQAQALETGTHLIVFAEPHGYVSPTLYERKVSVPTWDYMAVHAYGTAKIISERSEVLKLLEETIGFYESSYTQQWQQLPETYVNALLNELVAFEVAVTRIEAKKKLSQDRPRADRDRIREKFEQSADTNENLLAEYMKQEQKK